MLSDKIRAHLKAKTSQRRRRKDIEDRILSWLDQDQNCHAVWKVSDLIAAGMLPGTSVYNAVYELAAAGRIGFAGRTYHIFHLSDHETIKRTRPSRVGTLIWNKDYAAAAPIREDWLDDPITGQLPLFGGSLEELTNEDLAELIAKAERLQIKRGVDKRYACLSDGIREQLIDVFAKIKITDPVYFAHSDETISLLTYTAVPSMPIDVVIDVGDGPKRMSCKHLTIFGKEIINATDSIFGGE